MPRAALGPHDNGNEAACPPPWPCSSASALSLSGSARQWPSTSMCNIPRNRLAAPQVRRRVSCEPASTQTLSNVVPIVGVAGERIAHGMSASCCCCSASAESPRPSKWRHLHGADAPPRRLTVPIMPPASPIRPHLDHCSAESKAPTCTPTVWRANLTTLRLPPPPLATCPCNGII